jgi:hypothetical protein
LPWLEKFQVPTVWSQLGCDFSMNETMIDADMFTCNFLFTLHFFTGRKKKRRENSRQDTSNWFQMWNTSQSTRKCSFHTWGNTGLIKCIFAVGNMQWFTWFYATRLYKQMLKNINVNGLWCYVILPPSLLNKLIHHIFVCWLISSVSPSSDN